MEIKEIKWPIIIIENAVIEAIINEILVGISLL